MTAGAPGPGSASPAHPSDAIPLPSHGFDELDRAGHELAAVPAVELVNRAAVALMSASAGQLGLSTADEPGLDLDEARILITALAGLLAAAQDHLGPQAVPLREGLGTLQRAFREASSQPIAPGAGPGEDLFT